MQQVFVYGTLRQGAPNHNIIKMGRCELVGKVVVSGYDMFDTGMGYPGVIEGDGDVTGEVWNVDDDTVKALDMLEGVPHLYTKGEVDTPYGNAIIYLYANAKRLLGEDYAWIRNQVVYGDWLKYNQRTGEDTL